jgi:16S rRNA (guanine527-N7)-methyltransferase
MQEHHGVADTGEWARFFAAVTDIIGRDLSAAEQQRYRDYAGTLLAWNQQQNLIGPSAEQNLLSRHMLDSFSLYPHLMSSLPVTRSRGTLPPLADLGSGAGFPGLMLAILEDPSLRIDLLERSLKKCRFLQATTTQLGLEHRVRIIAEQRKIPPTGVYGAVFSRAVGDLAYGAVASWAWLLPGGSYLAVKGARYADELEQWQKHSYRRRFAKPDVLSGIGESCIIRLRKLS